MAGTSAASSSTSARTQVPGNLVWDALTQDLSYPPNVSSKVSLPREVAPRSETADIVIASFTILLITFGVIGNSTSLVYFWQRRKRAIYPKLYTMICAVDICSCLAATPVIVSLYNSRIPMIFENPVFCVTWAVMMTIFLKLAMFLVMLVSVTRTIAMTYPYHKIRSDIIVKVIIGYITIVCLIDVVVLASGWFDPRFEKEQAMCEIHARGKKAIHYVYSLLIQAELLLSSIVIFFSFAYGTFRLTNKRKERNTRRTKLDLGSKEDEMFLQVSITIAMFTAVFLLCNLPGFVLQLAYFLRQFKELKVEVVFFENGFVKWYGHLIFHFFLGLLNAAINPCLYFYRMPNYRIWTTEKTLSIPKLNKTRSALSFTCESRATTLN